MIIVKKREGRTFLQDTNAVSEVIGALLIMSIILSATTIYLSRQVPVWTKEFEAEHASKVPQDFAILASDIDMAILSEDPTASAATHIGMVPQSAPLIGIYASGGTLSFAPEAQRYTIACAPSTDLGPPSAGNWNASSNTPTDNFTIYDAYHIEVIPSYGARLELSQEEDMNFSSGGTDYFPGNYWLDDFTVTNNTTVVVSTLLIRAKTITIDEGSRITADGLGGAGGATMEDGTGSYNGFGEGGTYHSVGGGGAGYGGEGGAGGNYSSYLGGAGGSLYGNATNQSVEIGSGGGGGGNEEDRWRELPGGHGGNGGGYIWLEAQNISITGTISANGSFGYPGIDAGHGGHDRDASGGGGGGSGGGILINGDNVRISGMLFAVGGDGGDGGDGMEKQGSGSNSGSGGGGGAGGRIKVFYYSSDPGDINSYANVSGGAHGEKGLHDGGTNGTAGDPGTLHNESRLFTMRYPYYSYGYLMSDLTDIDGCVGKNTGSRSTHYGVMAWNATTDPGLTSITMKARTSLNASMSDAMDWDDDDFVAVTYGQDISDLPSVSDGHRYIQWRAELRTNDLYETPVLHSVNISYECGGDSPSLVDCSGNIEFNSQYLYLPNYKLIYAHGATIKYQLGCADFMLLAPPITIKNQSDGTSLKITSVNLTGINRTISGSFSSTVKAYYQDASLVTGGLNFYNLTINITTDYPAAWNDWFNESCENAGLAWGTNPGDYAINETGNTVQVTFYGDESRPVNLWLKKSAALIDNLE